MPLTDAKIRAAKPEDGKAKKLFDSEGLFLYVSPAGGKMWRMTYRVDGKAQTLSLGKYPAVSLLEARRRKDEAKALLAQGIDPRTAKREASATAAKARANAPTFEAVAHEWYERHSKDLSPRHCETIRGRLSNHLLPLLGSIPIAELDPPAIMAAIGTAEKEGHLEAARRALGIVAQICDYARLMRYALYNPARGLTSLLPKKKERHHAAITDPQEAGYLLRAIDAYPAASPAVYYALRIMPYTFVRNTELRAAEWAELDLEGATWTIPAHRMKMRRPHIVPLARQVVDMFVALRELTGGGALCFPSSQSRTRCISDMSLLNALRRMGYEREQMTVHGFRAMASTLLNEQGYRPDIIETQLAHVEKNAVRAAYNRADYLDERRIMMQQYADYLDILKSNLYHTA